MQPKPMDADEEPESFYLDGCIRLLAAVVVNAARDARRGSLEAADFLRRAEVNVDDVRPTISFFERMSADELQGEILCHHTRKPHRH